MSKLASYLDDEIKARNYGFFEDFTFPYVLGAATKLNNSSNNSGTFAIGVNASGGGNLPLVTGASTNNYNYALTTSKLFVMAADQPLHVHSQIQITDANVNTACMVFGVWSATIATILADTTFVPSTSATGALLFKQGATNYWQTCSSIGTSQITTNLNTAHLFNGASATGAFPQVTVDANEHELDIELMPTTSGNIEARYFIDRALVWKDAFAFTSPAAMYAVVGVKNGDGNSQTLNVRNFWGRQQRLAVTNLTV